MYVLRSLTDSTRYYTGVTGNWRARLEAHNAGHCPHTAGGGPWDVDVLVYFRDEKRALAFERYLNQGPAAPSPSGICGKHIARVHWSQFERCFHTGARAIGAHVVVELRERGEDAFHQLAGGGVVDRLGRRAPGHRSPSAFSVA